MAYFLCVSGSGRSLTRPLAGSSQQRQRVDNPDGRNHRKCQRKLPISSHSSRGNHLRNPQVGDHVRRKERHHGALLHRSG